MNRNLANNQLTSLDADVFVGCPSIEILYLYNNNLTIIGDQTFNSLPNLFELLLNIDHIGKPGGNISLRKGDWLKSLQGSSEWPTLQEGINLSALGIADEIKHAPNDNPEYSGI